MAQTGQQTVIDNSSDPAEIEEARAMFMVEGEPPQQQQRRPEPPDRQGQPQQRNPQQQQQRRPDPGQQQRNPQQAKGDPKRAQSGIDAMRRAARSGMNGATQAARQATGRSPIPIDNSAGARLSAGVLHIGEGRVKSAILGWVSVAAILAGAWYFGAIGAVVFLEDQGVDVHHPVWAGLPVLGPLIGWAKVIVGLQALVTLSSFGFLPSLTAHSADGRMTRLPLTVKNIRMVLLHWLFHRPLNALFFAVYLAIDSGTTYYNMVKAFGNWKFHIPLYRWDLAFNAGTPFFHTICLSVSIAIAVGSLPMGWLCINRIRDLGRLSARMRALELDLISRMGG